MRKTLVRLALAGAAVTVLAAGAASAQMPPAPAPPPMEMTMGMAPGMGGAMFMHHGRPDPEKRAQRLRDVLQLRPDQDGALKAYVDATSPKIFALKKEEVSKDKAGGEREWSEPKPMTTLERLDHMTKAADAIKARAEATRAFYTALTPSQQKTFDVLGMGEGEGGERIFVRRFDTRGPGPFKGGERRVVIERKVG